MRYHADPPAMRRTVPLGGMTLIYHRPSGMTHIVAEPVPELLDALAEGPADAGVLLVRLAERHGVEGGADAEAAVAARLAELEAVGLVARA